MNESNNYRLTLGLVHLWTASLIIKKEQELNYRKILSFDEIEKASKFRFQKDRMAYIASRGMLRAIASNYLNCQPNEIKFKYQKFGKPIFTQETSLQFNVSHSGKKVIIAFVKNYDIGVDIEYLKRDFNVIDIAHNFFSKKEIKALCEIEKKNRTRAFYRCWTRKESFIKAKGNGLSFPLDKFTVTLDKDLDASLIETQWDENEKDKWSLFSFVPYKNYMAGISVKGVISDFLCKEWNHSKGIL